MWGRCPRWGRLLLVAVLNLAVWVGLAVGVAMVNSDGVNLGIETIMRSGQATAMTYLQQLPAGRRAVEAEALAGYAAQKPSGDEIAEPKPAGMVATQDVSSPAGSYEAQSAASQASASSESSNTAAGGYAPAVADPAALAGSGKMSGVLVLSDPGFSGLMRAGSAVERAARGERVEIRYKEAALNEQIAALLADTPNLPYHDVRVSLRPDSIAVSGNVTVLGLGVSAELLGMLVAEDCAPQMDVHAVSVGGVLTPRFIKNQASSIVLRALDWYPPDAPLCLDRIELAEGSVTVYGYRR